MGLSLITSPGFTAKKHTLHTSHTDEGRLLFKMPAHWQAKDRSADSTRRDANSRTVVQKTCLLFPWRERGRMRKRRRRTRRTRKRRKRRRRNRNYEEVQVEVEEEG